MPSAITSPKRASQLINFHNMQYGTIMPTDLDAVLDLKGQGWVLIECKYGSARMPLGQRIALERLADDLSRNGKPVVVLVASHRTRVEKQVDLAKAKVTRVYENGAWHEMVGEWQPTVKEYVDGFIMTANIETLMGFTGRQDNGNSD